MPASEYCTIANVRALGDVMADMEQDGATPLIPDATITTAIQAASGDVEDAARRHYSVPFTVAPNAPGAIERATERLAFALVAAARFAGSAAESPVAVTYRKLAMDALTELRKGAMTLEVPRRTDDPDAATSSSSYSSTAGLTSSCDPTASAVADVYGS